MTTSIIDLRLPDTPRITAFPNPARDELTIRFPQQAGAAELTVFDLDGRLRYQQRLTFPGDGTGEFRLSTTTWPRGMYVYRLQIGEETYRDKVMIVR